MHATLWSRRTTRMCIFQDVHDCARTLQLSAFCQVANSRNLTATHSLCACFGCHWALTGSWWQCRPSYPRARHLCSTRSFKRFQRAVVDGKEVEAAHGTFPRVCCRHAARASQAATGPAGEHRISHAAGAGALAAPPGCTTWSLEGREQSQRGGDEWLRCQKELPDSCSCNLGQMLT